MWAKSCSAKRTRSCVSGGQQEKELYAIVLKHVEKYEGKRFYEGTDKLNEEAERTTNDRERGWRQAKRRCRRRHGRADAPPSAHPNFGAKEHARRGTGGHFHRAAKRTFLSGAHKK
jgi:hypothetical protein